MIFLKFQISSIYRDLGQDASYQGWFTRFIAFGYLCGTSVVWDSNIVFFKMTQHRLREISPQKHLSAPFPAAAEGLKTTNLAVDSGRRKSK